MSVVIPVKEQTPLKQFQSFMGVREHTYGTDSCFGGRNVTALLVEDGVAKPVTYSFDELKRLFLSLEDDDVGVEDFGIQIQKMDAESLDKLSHVSLFFETMRDLFKCMGSFCTKSLDEQVSQKIIDASPQSQFDAMAQSLLRHGSELQQSQLWSMPEE
ncbi:MAG: hypothetical protein COT85_04955 [Chlamydiae bacterium CG10_big_fil_rev_8_21_14_0_10_42_34]|nr:MAG: hypothetical protein COT85_04955 [Chlamydiae bacterium CG10_big_fil_rev_8_21_14_0_10_42_34]